MMQQAAERGAKLTTQLLAFSRRQRLEARPIQLNHVVAGMLDLLRSTLGGTIRLDTVLRDDIAPAQADQTQLELVILNLAINARDAMPAGGVLRLETGAETVGDSMPRRAEEPAPGNYVTIVIADSGTGMSPEVLAKAFEPFFTTKEVGKGSGLGLPQVVGFAKQSGGGVRIESEPDHGTTVTVFLPLAEAAVECGASEEAGPPPPLAERTLVLLVDDDDVVRETTAATLGELGYRVVRAESGAVALDRLAERDDIALMLVDFAMPGLNGADVARQALALRPTLPVVFITGFADATALIDVGEERIVTKPYTEAQLRRKLERALGEAALRPLVRLPAPTPAAD
jgi:CheY-like chemotaxis protein